MQPSIARPYAITMWDFSWLERRWPGAGYEDWERALSELVERGYDAVRIDAYPHLVAVDSQRAWNLVPAWNQTSWGAQSAVTVRVMPDLLDFIRAAADQGVAVALSSWFRQDADDVRMRIDTPEKHARIWIETLDQIRDAGLMESILYVDLCNEFPIPVWAPFLYPAGGSPEALSLTSDHLKAWMRDAIALVREAHPDLDYTFSFCTEFDRWLEQDVSGFDVLEPHVWMAHPETSDYGVRVGYGFEKFDPVGFDNLVANAAREYASDSARYDAALFATIDHVAAWSRATHLPLYTTECWALVDYKDWPGLDWAWIKDLTEKGLTYAASTGRWVGLATSNFCGPQFVGMWRDVEWHQRLTALIKAAPIDADLRSRDRLRAAAR